uniref:C-type lectin domain containing 1 n=1 Tax=Gasterosteus aculeatus aculeatus TaxID=481459 RepID=A0AAQ4P2H8_GASAC
MRRTTAASTRRSRPPERTGSFWSTATVQCVHVTEDIGRFHVLKSQWGNIMYTYVQLLRLPGTEAGRRVFEESGCSPDGFMLFGLRLCQHHPHCAPGWQAGAWCSPGLPISRFQAELGTDALRPAVRGLQRSGTELFKDRWRNVNQTCTQSSFPAGLVLLLALRLFFFFLVLALFISSIVKRCRDCPEGWLHAGDQCYYFSNDKLDWLKSRDSCADMGGHLTILHTMEQHDALVEEVKKSDGFDYHFWIGLSDLDSEGDWRWVDNTTLQHKYWDQLSSEPNNHQSGGEHGEDCATLDSHAKTWFDVPCEHIYKRICQMDVIQLD